MKTAFVVTPDNLLNKVMATSEHRTELLAAWISVMGSEEAFYEFYNTYMYPRMTKTYAVDLYDLTPQEAYLRFNTTWLSHLSSRRSAVYRIIQKKAVDPENIKPILIMFAMSLKHVDLKELSQWIHPKYAASFGKIVIMLQAGVESSNIPYLLDKDIDISLMLALLQSEQRVS